MPKKGKKKSKEIDWSDEANFDKNRCLLYIEHTLECPIFTMKADAFFEYLQKEMPDRRFVLVRNHFDKIEPRPGSFEIEISQHARTSRHNLWSGLTKGPPRRDKFPDFETLLPEVQKVLKKFYADTVENAEEDEGEQ